MRQKSRLPWGQLSVGCFLLTFGNFEQHSVIQQMFGNQILSAFCLFSDLPEMVLLSLFPLPLNSLLN